MPPIEGYGPADAGYSGSLSPFSAFDNRIRYNDMIRKQMISQYQQSTVRPSTMTLAQQRQVASDPRYQYGVPGGQDPRQYQRQAEISRKAFGASLASTTLDIAGWQTASAVVASAGIAGFSAFAIPFAATAGAGYLLNKGVDHAMDRQRFMHSIAGDVEMYRNNLSFNNLLSYGDATKLGKNISGNMFRNEGFFSVEQMNKIHKIGLSNNMVSAKGGGAGSSGTLKQYEKNVDELTKTTEEVVKLLQTTIEGGMSVMKELQQTGFGSMGGIRNQVRQAKAFGNMTGLGAQNVMQIGAAGASAVQGTPWAANVGASMYQSGAAQASYMSQLGSGQAYAVQRAGGAVGAGGVIARTNMNILSSGMGTAATSYAMNADGSTDQARMARLLSGDASAYEIVTGGAQRGYEMGQGGRVLFERNKADMLNNMNDIGRTQMVNRLFQQWSTNRPGKMDEKSWVFAGQFTTNQRDQRVFAASLLNPKGFEAQWGARQAVRAGSMDVDIRRARYTGPVVEAWGNAFAGMGRGWDDLGQKIVDVGGGAVDFATDVWGGVKRGVGTGWETAAWGLGLTDREGIYNRAVYGDATETLRAQYGTGRTVSRRGLAMLETGRALKSNVPSVNLGVDFERMMTRASSEDLTSLYQKTRRALYGGTADTMKDDPTVMRMLREYGATGAGMKAFGDSPIGSLNYIISGMNQQRDTVSKLAERGNTAWDNAWKANDSPEKRAVMNSKLYIAKQALAGKTDWAMSVAQKKGGWDIAHVQRISEEFLGVDLSGKEFRAPIQRALSETLIAKTQTGSESHAMMHDVEKAQKDAEAGLYSNIFGFKYVKEMTKGGKYTTSRWTGGYTEAGTGTAARKKVFRKILEDYTDLRGNKETFRLRGPEGQSRAYGVMQELIGEVNDPKALALKGRLAGLFSHGEDNSHQYFAKNHWLSQESAMNNLLDNTETMRAANIRNNKAERFGDYLRQGLGRKVTDKQQGFIKGVFDYGTTDKQILALSRGMGEEGVAELLSTGMGIPEQALKELATTPTEFRAKVAGSNPAMSYKEKTALQSAADNLVRWNVAARDADGKLWGKVTVEDGEGKEQKVSAKEAIRKSEEAQIAYDMQLKFEYADQRGKNSYANVQPPIMNYWNNRWTL